MAKLTERAMDLVQQARAANLSRRRAAGDELRALLTRNASPKEGDEQRLLELMEVLDIRAEDLPAVVNLLEEIQGHEAACAKAQEAVLERSRASAELNTVNAWFEAELAKLNAEAEAKRGPLEATLGRAQGIIRGQAEARRLLSIRLPEWQALVDGTSVEEARQVLAPPRGVPHGSVRRA